MAAGTLPDRLSMTVITDETQTCEQGAITAEITADSRASELRAITDRHYATSMSARGFFAAIINKVRAAPDGVRRPCSHS